MLELINYNIAVKDTLSLINPNSWKLNDFNPPIINNTSYTMVSKINPNIKIFIPQTSYPNKIYEDGRGIINIFDASITTYGYVGLPFPNNYLILYGLSGLITGIKITYWGDVAGQMLHIASKITLFPDNSNVGVLCTRPSQPNNSADKNLIYSMSKSVLVTKQLKILFENIPSGDGGEALLHKVEFIMKLPK